MNLLRLINICLNETIAKTVWVNICFDSFPIKNGLNEGEDLSLLLFNFVSGYVIWKAHHQHAGQNHGREQQRDNLDVCHSSNIWE
jgi:hypothetical protein